jgi:lipopolysaccharide transport system permease protein
MSARRATVTVIRPSSGWALPDLRELWEYRELLYFFVWRDITVRYKQTVLGAAWAVLQPFFTMVVFSIFFGALAGVPSDGLPYPVFSFSALVVWQLFATGLNQGANSVVKHQNLVKKVYFPRLALPTSAVLSGIVDFAIAFVVLLALMAYYGYMPTTRMFWLPALITLALLTSLGVAYWLSALTTRYRDFQYITPFLVQAWLFITPIAYPSSLLPEQWRAVYAINPMAGVVEGFRWALVGADTRPDAMILVSSAVTLTVLLSGLVYFRRLERTMADVV